MSLSLPFPLSLSLSVNRPLHMITNYVDFYYVPWAKKIAYYRPRT